MAVELQRKTGRGRPTAAYEAHLRAQERLL